MSTKSKLSTQNSCTHTEKESSPRSCRSNTIDAIPVSTPKSIQRNNEANTRMSQARWCQDAFISLEAVVALVSQQVCIQLIGMCTPDQPCPPPFEGACNSKNSCDHLAQSLRIKGANPMRHPSVLAASDGEDVTMNERVQVSSDKGVEWKFEFPRNAEHCSADTTCHDKSADRQTSASVNTYYIRCRRSIPL